MGSRGTRRLLLAAAVTMMCALSAPASAPAALSLNLQVGAPVGTLLNNVQTSLSTLPGAITGVTCPATGSVPVVDTVTCNIDLLAYRWHARFMRPDGTILKRDIGALLNVPTLLNVDDDEAPDVIATLQVLSLDRFTMRVDRALGETGTLPLSLEAIVRDPTKGSLPRELINFGFDAKASRTPTSFQSTISLLPEAGGTRLRLDNTTGGSGQELRIVGGLFNGTPSTRDDEAGGALEYAPVPASSSAELAIGNRYAATLTTSSPTTLDVDAFFNQGPDRKAGGARIEQLPASLGVALTPGANDTRTATYTAAARVAKVIASYRHTVANTPLEVARVDARDLPTGITVHQTGPQDADLTTTGGPIGSVEVGFANGEPKLLATTDHYFHIFDDGNLHSLSAKADGIRSAAFAGGSKIVAEAELASKPFTVDINEVHRQVSGRLVSVPSHLKATIDLPNGAVDYDGFGSTIQAIDVQAHQDTPFFGRATRVTGAVRNLPAKVAIGFRPDATTASFTASAPVGSLEVAAYPDGQAAELPANGENGLVYRDVPNGRYAIGARINGLERVTFAMPKGQPLKLGTKIQPGPLSLDYQDADQTVSGRIADVPGTIELTGDLAQGAFDYTASAPIGSIVLDADRPGAPYFLKATHVHAKVTDVPEQLALHLVDGAKSLKFAASPRIGAIEVSATDGGVRLPDGTDNAAIYKDTGSEFTIAGRIKGLKELRFGQSAGGFTAGVDIDKAPLRLEYEDAERKVSGAIADVPGAVDLNAELANGKIGYTASDRIGRISVDATKKDGSAWFGRAKLVHAALVDLPKDLALDFKSDGGTVANFTTTDRIGAVELSATEKADPNALPAGDAAGIRFRDTVAEFALGARIRDLKGASFEKTAGGFKVGADVAHAPFGLSYADDEQTLEGEIADLPGHMEADLDLTAGKITYDADEPIALIDVDALRPGKPFYGRATRVHAALRGLPKHLELNFKPQAGGPDLHLLSGDPIGAIELSATDVEHGEAPLPEGDRNGVLYNDTDERFVAAARLKGLREATFKGGPEFEVTARVTPGPVYIDFADRTRTLTGHLKDVPGYAQVTIKPADGTYRYVADAPIGEIFGELHSTEPFLARAKNARITLKGVPAGVTVTVTPKDVDGDGNAEHNGFDVVADEPVGSISAALSDGELHELDTAGAYLRYTPSEFKAALKVNGLKRVQVDPDPLFARIEAGAGQVFNLDVQAEVDDPALPDPCEEDPTLCEDPCEVDPSSCDPDPCDATLAPKPDPCDLIAAKATATAEPRKMIAKITGVIDQLPSQMTVARAVNPNQDAIGYTASSRIGRIELDAENLPGDSKWHLPLKAHVRIDDVPSQWGLNFPKNDKLGFTTSGEGVGKIEAEAWHLGDRWTGLPAGNLVKVEELPTSIHAFARISGFEQIDIATGNRPGADVKFRGQQGPLTLDAYSKPITQVTALKATIYQPPQQIHVGMEPGATAKIAYRASAPIPRIDLQAVLQPKAIIDATLRDIPAELDICVDKGVGCNEGDWYDYLQELGFSLHTSPQEAPIKATARVCLDVNGIAWTVDACRNDARRYLQVYDLEFKDVAFEFGAGDVPCGGPINCPDGDNTPIWADTGDYGIRTPYLLYYDPDFPVKKGVFFKRTGGSFHANHWGALIDSTAVPTIDAWTGALNCGGRDNGEFRVGLVNSVAPDETVEITNLTGLFRTVFCPTS